MPNLVKPSASVLRRWFGWTLTLLALYSLTMAFVLVFSLVSAYDRVQRLTENGSPSKEVSTSTIMALESDARRAAAAANDPSVAFLEFIPWIGSDVHVARVLSLGLDNNLKSLGPLIQQRDALSLGKADLPKTIEALAGSMDALDQSIMRFDADLQKINPQDLHFGLGAKVLRLKTLIKDVKQAVHEGSPLVKTASVILNQPGKSTWFLATQNAAELRASGGLLGSYAVVAIEDGKIKLQDFGADAKLLSKGRLNVAFDATLENVWGADLGDWRDLNVSSHIPDDGKIISDAWEQKFHQKLDGVVFFSQGTVAHLLGATGPVNLRGLSLNSDNSVDFLTKGIYAQFPDVKQKNRVVSNLMKAIFQRLSSQKLDPAGLFKSLSNTRNEDTIYLWASSANVQEEIQNKGLDGSITKAAGPMVVVGINNGGGNKLDAYLKTAYEYTLGKCGTKTWDNLPGRHSSVAVTLTNQAPKSGLPAYVNPRLDLRRGEKWVPSSNHEVISIYAPIGSTDEYFTINGMEAGGQVALSQDHPLYVLDVYLGPGETKTVKVSFIEPVVDSVGKRFAALPQLRSQQTLGGSKTRASSIGECTVR